MTAIGSIVAATALSYLPALTVCASGPEPERSNSAAERVWSKCVKTMRQAKTLDADYALVVRPNGGKQSGKIHLGRDGKISWRYRFDDNGKPGIADRQSDGRKATLNDSSEPKAQHMSHADFMHYHMNAMPAGQEFYERDGLTKYRDPKGRVKLAGRIRLGRDRCRVMIVPDPNGELVTRYYIRPDGAFCGYLRKWKQEGTAYETELRIVNLRLLR